MADTFRDQLYFIDPSSLTINATIALPGAPVGMAYDSRTGTLWVSLGGFFYADGIDVLNASTGVSISEWGGSWLPGGITYHPASNQMFVADVFDDEVRVFNASNLTRIAVVPVGTLPDAILYVPSSGDVYVANLGGSNLSIISGTNDSSVGSWNVSGSPLVLGYNPAAGALLVANDSSFGFEVLNVANEIVAGELPIPYASGFAYDPSTGQTIVFNGSSSIAFVNVSSLSFATTASGKEVTSGAWAPGVGLLANDPEVGAVYLLATGGTGLLTNLTVHVDPEVASPGDPVTITVTFSGGLQPITIAFSGLPSGCTLTNTSTVHCAPTVPGLYRVEVEATGATGITSSASAMLWVDRTYPVEVAATGLPAGTPWSFLLFGGFTWSTTTAEIAAPVLNGTYLFIIAADGPYLPTPGRELLEVSGAPVGLTVAFLPAYTVTFDEVGLPAEPSGT